MESGNFFLLYHNVVPPGHLSKKMSSRPEILSYSTTFRNTKISNIPRFLMGFLLLHVFSKVVLMLVLISIARVQERPSLQENWVSEPINYETVDTLVWPLMLSAAICTSWFYFSATNNPRKLCSEFPAKCKNQFFNCLCVIDKILIWVLTRVLTLTRIKNRDLIPFPPFLSLMLIYEFIRAYMMALILIKATSIHLHSNFHSCSKPLQKTCFSFF